MSNWALIKDGVVWNIIVVDAEDPDFAIDHAKDPGSEWDSAVQVDSLDPKPAIGWVKKGTGYVPPEQMSTDKDSIAGDGVESATVTYTDNRPTFPDEVTFMVNGGESDPVTLVDGSASIDVTSATPGDEVDVSCGGVGVSIEVV